MLNAYYRVRRHSDCPQDRHAVEQLYFTPQCVKPGLRLCRTRLPSGYTRHGNVLHRMERNVNWTNFKPASTLQQALEASSTGRIRGVHTPMGGRDWGRRAWDFKRMSDTYRQTLPKKYEAEWHIPLSNSSAEPVRLALDIGGGSGQFALALREQYGVFCITLTQDNAPGRTGHFFDLPFVEAIVEERLPALVWSGADRLPLPDSSVDLINSEAAVVNFTDDDDVFMAILYDWDRMLRPGGHVVISGRLDVAAR